MSTDFEVNDSTLALTGSGAGRVNAIYGGRDLMDVFGTNTVEDTLTALSEDIANDFEKVRLGDYITVGTKVGSGSTRNLNFVVAAADYFYNMGDTPLTTHHVLMVPSSAFFDTARMNSSNTTAGGYYGSEMHGVCDVAYTAGTGGALTSVRSEYVTFAESDLGSSSGTYAFVFDGTDWQYGTESVGISDFGVSYSGTPVEGDTLTVTFTRGNLENYRQAIYDALGEDHIITHRGFLSISDSTGAWHDLRVELMSESMVYGHTIRANNVYGEISANTQLPLFSNNHSNIIALKGITGYRLNIWLTSIASSSAFCDISSGGLASANGATNNFGVRPYFLFA